MQTLGLGDLDEQLPDLLGRMRLLDRDGLRLAHEARGQRLHALGIGGREHQRLALRRTVLEHLLDLVGGSPCRACGRPRPAPGWPARPAPGWRGRGDRAPGRACPPRCARRARGSPAAAAPASRRTASAPDVVFGGHGAPRQPPGRPVRGWGTAPGACTAKRRRFRLASSGGVKAAVLPLPVLAWAIRSRPARRQRQAGGLDGRHPLIAQGLQIGQRGRRQRQSGKVAGNGEVEEEAEGAAGTVFDSGHAA